MVVVVENLAPNLTHVYRTYYYFTHNAFFFSPHVKIAWKMGWSYGDLGMP